jgi:hypothetical protein
MVIIVYPMAGCLSYTVQSVAVSAEGNAAAMNAGETLQFTSEVVATGKDLTGSETVNWTVSSTEAGNGPVTTGTSISPSGMLKVSIDEIYPVLWVKATSAAYSKVFGSRQVQISGPKVGSVTLTAAGNATSVASGGTLKFTATAAGRGPNQGITFSVGSASNATGTVASGTSISADGTLTVAAGETANSLFVRAVSATDATKTDTREVRVVTVTSVTVTAAGGTARVARGGRLQFSAAVAGKNDPAATVTWKVSSTADGTGTVTSGTAIAANGTLTVAVGEAASTLYVIAASTVDTTKSGSLAVVIPTVTGVTISPASVTVKRGEGQSFTAAVQGTGDPRRDVTWKVEGVGGVAVSAITTNGVLTVSTAEALSSLVVTTASADNPAISASAMVTIPATPAAVPDVPTDPNFTLAKSGNALTITSYTGSGGAVNIPPSIQNIPVTRIESMAFAQCTSVTSVAIPNTVTAIGERAFYSCTGLTSITIPSGVTSIGSQVFNGCWNLNSVTFAGTIPSSGLPVSLGLGDLNSVYLAGGPGTYTRPADGNNWTKQ